MKQLTKIAALIAALAFCFVSCKTTDVPLVILDTDLGSSTDDLFALQMLHHYEQEGRCKLLGVVVDRMGEANAALADAFDFVGLALDIENAVAVSDIYIKTDTFSSVKRTDCFLQFRVCQLVNLDLQKPLQNALTDFRLKFYFTFWR